jgi:hypothetical protein
MLSFICAFAVLCLDCHVAGIHAEPAYVVAAIFAEAAFAPGIVGHVAAVLFVAVAPGFVAHVAVVAPAAFVAGHAVVVIVPFAVVSVLSAVEGAAVWRDCYQLDGCVQRYLVACLMQDY